MSVSIVCARYGPQQITDPGIPKSLKDSISNFRDVDVDPEVLNNGVDPAPGKLKTAFVIYHNRDGDAVRFRAATDFKVLNFSRGILWIFYGPVSDHSRYKVIVDQSVYDQVYASFLSGGTFTLTNGSMGSDPYPNQKKSARIGYSLNPGGTPYTCEVADFATLDWKKVFNNNALIDANWRDGRESKRPGLEDESEKVAN